MKPDLVLDARAELGEGPVWHDGHLYWVDILPGLVHRYDPATRTDETMSAGEPVGALVPRTEGGLLLAVQHGLAVVDDFGDAPKLVAEIEADDPATRMNDGKCDRHGRFWVSTMAFDATAGAGTFYRIDPDLTVTPMLDGLDIGNGLAWSADDRTLYFIDSLTHGVDALDFDPGSGAITNRRQVIAVPEQDGIPDGMAIDTDGGLWVALYSGGQVRRYTPDGTLDEVVDLPASNPTCCAFGGDDLGDLYITTARAGLEPEDIEQQPLNGGLFVVRPGVTGTPADTFAA